jgi:hypothetical protein
MAAINFALSARACSSEVITPHRSVASRASMCLFISFSASNASRESSIAALLFGHVLDLLRNSHNALICDCVKPQHCCDSFECQNRIGRIFSRDYRASFI